MFSFSSFKANRKFCNISFLLSFPIKKMRVKSAAYSANHIRRFFSGLTKWPHIWRLNVWRSVLKPCFNQLIIFLPISTYTSTRRSDIRLELLFILRLTKRSLLAIEMTCAISAWYCILVDLFRESFRTIRTLIKNTIMVSVLLIR